MGLIAQTEFRLFLNGFNGADDTCYPKYYLYSARARDSEATRLSATENLSSDTTPG